MDEDYEKCKESTDPVFGCFDTAGDYLFTIGGMVVTLVLVGALIILGGRWISYALKWA